MMPIIRSSANMFVLWFFTFFQNKCIKIFIVALSLILVVNLLQARIVLRRKLHVNLDVRHLMVFKLCMFLVAYVCWLGCGSRLCKYVGVIFSPYFIH